MCTATGSTGLLPQKRTSLSHYEPVPYWWCFTVMQHQGGVGPPSQRGVPGLTMGAVGPPSQRGVPGHTKSGEGPPSQRGVPGQTTGRVGPPSQRVPRTYQGDPQTPLWDCCPIVVFEGPAGTGTGRLMFTSSVYWCPGTSKEKTHIQIIIIDTCESTTFDHSFHLWMNPM